MFHVWAQVNGDQVQSVAHAFVLHGTDDEGCSAACVC